jgi:glycosyltransferase involved in cell wall biosynthesis
MINQLSIIIPVFNEQQTIYKLLDKIADLSLINNVKKEIIVVNDASTDASKDKIIQFINENPSSNIVFIDQPINKGKGGAVKSGIAKASGDYCVIQDADLELDPTEINTLLQPIIDNEANIVYGSRFLNNKKHEKEVLLNRMANKFLTWLSNLIMGVKLTDMQTCYKMIPTELYNQLTLKENGFAFDPEITAKLAKNKQLKWKEVPISYHPRTKEEGKKIRWSHGFRQLYSIIKYGLFKS